MEWHKTVQDNVDWLSSIGNDVTGGMTRLLYSDSWLAAQKGLEHKLNDLGFTTTFDEIGNLFGRIEGSKYPNETIMSGSHVDTVVNGGTLDGQFGIIAAYIAMSYLLEEYGQPLRSMEVISMAEEEGSRFPTVFWGSKNFVGIANNAEVEHISDGNGQPFVSEMRKCGFDFRPLQTKREDIKAFLELHIEQGNVLEKENKKIGIVTDIAGQKRYTIILKGEANHAGTTPMIYRHDTIEAFSRIVCDTITRAKAEGEPLVATFGRVEPKPNTVNVVPGETLFSFDCRHTNKEKLEAFTQETEQRMRDIAEEMGIEIDIDLWMNEDPVPMATTIVTKLVEVAEATHMNYRLMHSGAGHDSQIIAKHYPTAMLFIPSIKGISHNPAEATSLDDLVEGVKMLAASLYEMAYKE